MSGLSALIRGFGDVIQTRVGWGALPYLKVEGNFPGIY